MLNNAKTSFKRIKEISNEYTYFDMHVHSKYSDGRASIQEIVKKARKLGIGVAITDHNEILGALEISKYTDVASIPGIEVTTKEGIHILFYFYTTEELSSFYNHIIFPLKRSSYSLDLGVIDLLNYSKDFKCLIVAPHPYSISWMGVCDNTHKDLVNNNFFANFDAIEVINGENLQINNFKALELSERLKLPITAGSDAHTLHELGKVLTYVKEEKLSIEIFLNRIKKGQSFTIGKASSIISKVVSQSGKITVPVKDPVSYIQKSYIYIKKVILV